MQVRAFTEHPASVGESYFEHQRVALSVGLRLVAAGLACIVHAFAPWLFVDTGSRTIFDLHRRLTTRRVAAEDARPSQGLAA
ncbi:MAG: DUF6356 family protein [Caulobacteraceae bacterium]|jgi:hypothetical protein